MSTIAVSPKDTVTLTIGFFEEQLSFSPFSDPLSVFTSSFYQERKKSHCSFVCFTEAFFSGSVTDQCFVFTMQHFENLQKID
jgi:hypothetical protein